MEKYKVNVEFLKNKCNYEILNFNTTEEVPPLEGIIGQDRAKKALEFGLKIKSKGYNIYVSGITGSGRTTSVEQAVRKIAEEGETPDDWCYVYNFTNPDMPNALRFPPGKANEFKKDMEMLVNELKIELPKTFESEVYEEHKNQIIKEFQNKRNELFEQIERSAKEAGFQIKQTPSGVVFVPVIEGQLLKEEDLEKLTDEAKNEIRKKQEMLYEELNDILRKIREYEKEAKEKLNKLEKETAQFTIAPRIKELKEKYKEFEDVCKYLDDVEKDMIENVEDFKERREIELLPGLKLPDRESSLYRYTVNVLIDNSQTKGAPVVKETNPTAYNLCGRIEYRPHFGAMVTDFTMIKPGALHKANGGYLILQVLDVLKNYFAWETLKRALKNNEIIIEDLNEQFRLINTPTLRPQPIPLDVKVILIGHPIFYYLLYAYDEDFRKLFKVKADFSLLMDKNEEGYKNYSAFISKICKEENLRPFDKYAVGKIIEYGSRIVEDRDKLTTRFIEIADIIREANFWAEMDNSPVVQEKHVKKALEEKIYRSNLIEKRIEELIKEGTIMVDTDGEKVGQINGLSVISLGDYTFGKPSKITCNVYVGKSGVINIDREVKLAGRIHNKGFLILNNYILEKYGSQGPIAFSASICFEQLYEEIEGDSASSTEIYVLLSALANVPIKQGIAVTGSVNQKGEIQPVGGINEKIEGFYYTCKAKGLTGKQGVIIPEKNLKHLILNDEVIEAVEKGLFHIWAVKTIDEGIEILTGIPAGEKREDGTYPEGTINYLVSKRLEELTEKYLKSIKGKKNNKKKNKEKK
ncbi:MAG: AAA family ATPase [Candidatus Omnitrophica bacterium]|nr:AAA family ATPase [Candidatus Omnitrophota bacterium]MCM8806500.1 AAA family ATPase [Candidatus Omnitrophota bacterium]